MSRHLRRRRKTLDSRAAAHSGWFEQQRALESVEAIADGPICDLARAHMDGRRDPESPFLEEPRIAGLVHRQVEGNERRAWSHGRNALETQAMLRKKPNPRFRNREQGIDGLFLDQALDDLDPFGVIDGGLDPKGLYRPRPPHSDLRRVREDVEADSRNLG